MKSKLTALFLATACTVGVFSLSPAEAAKNYVLKLSTFEPMGNHYTRWLQGWAQRLNKESKGRLKIEIFPSNQMGSLRDQYDLARTGVADISFALEGATPGRFPLSQLAHLPFLIPSAEVGSESLTALLPKYLASQYKGVHVLFLTSTSPLPIVTSKVAVRRPQDLKGLRIRHPDRIAAATLKALGAVPVFTPPGQIADALNKGTIDGALFAWEALKPFQISARYGTAWGGNVTTFVLAMNPTSYKSLPPDLRKMIDNSVGVKAARSIGRAADAAAKAGRAYERKNHMEVINLTPRQREAFKAATKGVVEKLIAQQEKKEPNAAQFIKALRKKISFYESQH